MPSPSTARTPGAAVLAAEATSWFDIRAEAVERHQQPAGLTGLVEPSDVDAGKPRSGTGMMGETDPDTQR